MRAAAHDLGLKRLFVVSPAGPATELARGIESLGVGDLERRNDRFGNLVPKS